MINEHPPLIKTYMSTEHKCGSSRSGEILAAASFLRSPILSPLEFKANTAFESYGLSGWRCKYTLFLWSIYKKDIAVMLY